MPVAERPRSRRRPRPVSIAPRTDGWWGNGPPPTERWPGVTIEFPALWVPLIGARRAVLEDDDGREIEAWVNRRGEAIPDWWAEDGGRWESPDHRFYFDRGEADRACDFFPMYLRHHIGEFAGQPFALLEYQQLLLTRPIFGWKRAADGLRRIRKVFAFLPKGAGKSPWGAGIGLYLTLCDREPAAEVYAVAGDKDQARTVHTNAKVMVEESEDLADMCEVWKDAIYHPLTRSTYKVISSDASTKHGFRPHGIVFDEFHAQKTRDLYEALKKSMVKRRQPLLLLISHAGVDDESVCFEEYEYAKKVLSGTIPDDTMLPVIFEMTSDDDWRDPAVHARVNPGHGITVKADAVEQECLEAQHEPRKLNDFLRFHGNRWVNQATAWIPIDWFDRCKGVLDDALLSTLECAAGLDLAQKWDLAAFVVVFRQWLDSGTTVEVVNVDHRGEAQRVTMTLNYRLYVRPFFWIPENTMQLHAKEDRVPYPQWRDQQLLTATDGDIIDYSRIYNDIATKILPRYPLLKQGIIGYDPAFATDLAPKLRDFAGVQIQEVKQNYIDLSEPAQVVEALIKGQRLVHDGHRVYRWNWENVAVKRDDAGRIRPVKPRSPSKRIDGVVATIMGQAVLPPPQPQHEPFFLVLG